MWIKLIEMMKENKLDNVILEDHRNLLDALHRKESEQAQKIMCNYFNQVRNIYFDIIDND